MQRTLLPNLDDNSIVESDAVFSPCTLFRYSLTRIWTYSKPRLCFCMLNGSTAGKDVNDPTVRRCIGYAIRWGYGSLEVVNLFGWRSTDPKVLPTIKDPIGPDNDEAIRRAVARSAIVVCAWGTHGDLNNRGLAVKEMIPADKRRALRITKDGFPAHPLYLPGNLQPIVW